MAAQAQQIIEGLREQIKRIERRPSTRGGCVPSGRTEVDALLPGRGFPRGALSELAGGHASGKTAIALSALAAAMGDRGLGAFIDGRGELYPPAAAALGVELARLLVVRPFGPPGTRQRLSTALWAAEAILASGAFEGLVIDLPAGIWSERERGAGPEAMLRRVKMAAEKGGALALWLDEPAGGPVPAAVRLEVSGESGSVQVRLVHDRGMARDWPAPGGLAVAGRHPESMGGELELFGLLAPGRSGVRGHHAA